MSDEQRPTVGVDSVYIAEVTADTASDYTAGTPESLAPVGELKVTPAVNVEVVYADDQVYDVAQGEGQTDIEMILTGVVPETLATLIGGHFESSEGRVYDRAAPNQASYYALGFRSQKTNGSYKYFWYLKGRFTKPEENYKSLSDSPESQKTTLKFTAFKTAHSWGLDDPTTPTITDGVIRVWGDEDTTSFSSTGWFTSVQEPNPS